MCLCRARRHASSRQGARWRKLPPVARTTRAGAGVDDALIFHNRFLSQEELNEFLAAADIYITPYLQPEQITSGTLAYERRWLEDEGSEDSDGRALWALGATVGRSPHGELRTLAGELFTAALPAVSSFTSPRAWAFTLLGVSEYLGAFDGDRRVQALGHALADRLLGLLTRTSRHDWCWFEDRVTYCNAHLPEALIATGAWTGRDDLTRAGLRSLEWLASIQRSPAGVFAPRRSSPARRTSPSRPHAAS